MAALPSERPLKPDCSPGLMLHATRCMCGCASRFAPCMWAMHVRPAQLLAGVAQISELINGGCACA